VTPSPAASQKVPFHSLGISQILSYGCLFYAFAQLKIPLAAQIGVAPSDILAAVTGALLIQAFLAPLIGGWIDKYGALTIMTRGLMLGAFGMALLPVINSLWWVWLCMVPIGIGFAMSSYETAFSAAVQIDETKSRRHISFITFYGGVASSVIWLSIAPLLNWFGLQVTCLICAAALLLMGVRAHQLHQKPTFMSSRKKQQLAPFHWLLMTRNERRALFALASASALEYLTFASTTLLWITWFSMQFNDTGLAVMLAALYGPFQTVGRLLEMKFAHQFDARLTGMASFIGVPMALILAQQDGLHFAVAAMMIFGMGHGILTVSFGYVTNMYFSADVYGRAKGWITMPRALGNAIGPSLGGILFLLGPDIFFGTMIGISLLSAASFAVLFSAKPRDMPAPSQTKS
jgi:MFS family permease